MTSDPWDRSGDNHAVALIISNAYRARHGMQPLDVHAVVDEDIADAILSSDWLARVKAEAVNEALEAVIAEAPHTDRCRRNNPYFNPSNPAPCDCWKSTHRVGADQ